MCTRIRQTILLALMCLVFALWRPAQAHVEIIQKGSSDTMIIFVHGFWGSPEGTFQKDSQLSWPRLMATDPITLRGQAPLNSHGIAILAYPTGPTSQLTIPSLSQRLLTALQDANVYADYKHIIVIAHSMGGLVVKSMWRQSKIQKTTFANNVKAIFLIGVPSLGVDMNRFTRAVAEFAGGRQIIDLASIDNNTFLESMERDWLDLMRTRSVLSDQTFAVPRVYCAHEIRDTTYKGVPLGRLVPITSIATSCDENSTALDANHIDLVKPSGHTDYVYQWVKGRIADLEAGMALEKIPALPLPVKTSEDPAKAVMIFLKGKLRNNDWRNPKQIVADIRNIYDGSELRDLRIVVWVAMKDGRLEKRLDKKVEFGGREFWSNEIGQIDKITNRAVSCSFYVYRSPLGVEHTITRVDEWEAADIFHERYNYSYDTTRPSAVLPKSTSAVCDDIPQVSNR